MLTAAAQSRPPEERPAIVRLDVAYAQDCRIWGLAAGALLVEQAGGRCTGLAGEPLFPVDPAACPQPVSRTKGPGETLTTLW